MTVSGRVDPISFWTDGSPFSKANSRRIVKIGNTSRSIKSQKALDFQREFQRQCPKLDPLFQADLHIDLDIFYPDRRRDLDESLVLDAMQGLVYANDRQIKSRRVRWNLSKERPGILIGIRLCRPEDYAETSTFPAEYSQ